MSTVALADGAVTVLDAGRRRDLVLTRPQARNAISPAMLDALTGAVAQATSDGVAVLVLRGEGPGFCAGADIASYAGGDADSLAAFTRAAVALCDAIEEFDGVVVAVVHGACLGGGFEIALASDLVVAAEDARLGLPELRLGLIPGWGGTQRLTRLVGPAVARSLVLTSELIDGRRAEALGVVHRAVPRDQLDQVVAELVLTLLEGPAQALVAAKRAIAAAAPPTELGPSTETSLLLELFGSADGQEGVAAFVGKRRARFGGARTGEGGDAP